MSIMSIENLLIFIDRKGNYLGGDYLQFVLNAATNNKQVSKVEFKTDHNYYVISYKEDNKEKTYNFGAMGFEKAKDLGLVEKTPTPLDEAKAMGLVQKPTPFEEVKIKRLERPKSA